MLLDEPHKSTAVYVDLNSGRSVRYGGDEPNEVNSSSLQNSFKRFREQKIRERKLLLNMQKDRFAY